ncbi:hypothetical protein D3C75_1162380 [compost metagenome]
MHRLPELLLEQRLALLQCLGRFGRELHPLGPGEGEQFLHRQHLVGQPESQRLPGVYGLRQQQQLCRLQVTHGAGQQEA